MRNRVERRTQAKERSLCRPSARASQWSVARTLVAVAVVVACALTEVTVTLAAFADEPTLDVPQTHVAAIDRADIDRLGSSCDATFCRHVYAVSASLPLVKRLPDRYESALSMMKGWIVGRSWHFRDDVWLTMLQGDRYFTLTSPWLPTASLSFGPAFAGGGSVVGLRIPF